MLCITNTIRVNETIIVQSLRVWLQDRSRLSSPNCQNTLLYIIWKSWEQSEAWRVCASVFVFSSAPHRTHHLPQTAYVPPVASFSFPILHAQILPLHPAANKGAERLHYITWLVLRIGWAMKQDEYTFLPRSYLWVHLLVNSYGSDQNLVVYSSRSWRCSSARHLS